MIRTLARRQPNRSPDPVSPHMRQKAHAELPAMSKSGARVSKSVAPANDCVVVVDGEELNTGGDNQSLNEGL